jgi:hypothetical protein
MEVQKITTVVLVRPLSNSFLGRKMQTLTMQEIEEVYGAARDGGIVGLDGFVEKSPSINVVSFCV